MEPTQPPINETSPAEAPASVLETNNQPMADNQDLAKRRFWRWMVLVSVVGGWLVLTYVFSGAFLGSSSLSNVIALSLGALVSIGGWVLFIVSMIKAGWGKILLGLAIVGLVGFGVCVLLLAGL
jgi:hypothetical protein